MEHWRLQMIASSSSCVFSSMLFPLILPCSLVFNLHTDQWGFKGMRLRLLASAAVAPTPKLCGDVCRDSNLFLTSFVHSPRHDSRNLLPQIVSGLSPVGENSTP